MKNLFLLVPCLFLVSCNSANFDSSPEADGLVFNIIDYDVNKFSLDRLVCDPFQEGQASATNGLKASLYSVSPDNPQDIVEGFLKNGTKSTQDIYFSSLNVPTREFSLGFPTQTGGEIKNDDGEIINEWFALSMETELTLGLGDEEGLYELAILSDDGSVISAKDAFGNYQVVVDNNGYHETQLGCGQTFNMTRGQTLPIKIDYFQGVRYHISVVPMWRKVTASTAAEPLCGQKGNDLFFDSENGSAPQPAYQALLSRGWKPMSADNWKIPGVDQGEFNPCAGGEDLEMNNYEVVENSEGVITITWSTDRPATSQVQFKNLRTDRMETTLSDNILRLEHSVQITIRNRADAFQFIGISISKDLGKGISEPYTLNIQAP